MLNREHRESVVVKIKALVVRENDFVDAKLQRVWDPTMNQVDDVECVVFKGAAGGLKYCKYNRHLRCVKKLSWTYRRDRFVVGVKLVEMRSQIIGNENCSANNHMLSIIAEQTAFSIELLLTSIHVHNVFELRW